MLIALLVFLLCLRPFGVLGPWACWAGAPLVVLWVSGVLFGALAQVSCIYVNDCLAYCGKPFWLKHLLAFNTHRLRRCAKPLQNLVARPCQS